MVTFDTAEDCVLPEHSSADPYKVARESGILVQMAKVDNDLTLELIAKRVLDQKAAFEAKFAKKNTSEQNYYMTKKHVEEATQKHK